MHAQSTGQQRELYIARFSVESFTLLMGSEQSEPVVHSSIHTLHASLQVHTWSIFCTCESMYMLSGALHRSLLSVLKCMWPCIDSCFYESSTCFLCKFRLQCVVRFVSILHDIIIVFYCCCAMFREWLSQFLTWAYHCNANVNLYLPIKLQPAYPSSDQNPVMESVCVFYFHCVLCSVPLYGMDLETFLGQIATYHPELSRSTKNRMGSTTEHGESRRHGCCLCLLKSLYG